MNREARNVNGWRLIRATAELSKFRNQVPYFSLTGEAWVPSDRGSRDPQSAENKGGCGACTGWHSTPEDAVAVWNKCSKRIRC